MSLEIWADKKDFAKDNKEMLSRAKNLFAENCGICHALHPEKNLPLMLGLLFFTLWQIEQGLIKKIDG